MKRFLVLLVTLALFVALFSTTAFADNSQSPNEAAPGTSPKTGVSVSVLAALGVAAVSSAAAVVVSHKKDD